MTAILSELTTPTIEGERRVLIPHVDWNFYIAFREELDRQGSRSVHLTYDRGSLEVMTTSMPHEWYKKIIARLVETLATERRIETKAGGGMTFGRKDLEKGLEPDDCWWIAHEPQMRGKGDFDPYTDPPPDLVIEVEISNPLLEKLSIYAEFGVPEIWRFDGRELTFWQLRADRSYQRVESSLAFPVLQPDGLLGYLRIDDQLGDTSRAQRFLEWLRERQRESE